MAPDNHNHPSRRLDWRVVWQYLVPQQLISKAFGFLANLTCLPKLRHWILSKYVSHYQVDLTEAERSELSDYHSFNDFFTRQLKAGSRPLAGDNVIVSPVDGKISQYGSITEHGLLQAKGRHYDLATLVAHDKQLVSAFDGGQFMTLYLSPRDYHRIHLPWPGQLTSMTYVPGRLFAVNPLSAEAIPALFTRNERLICHFDGSFGPFAVVFVGAFIVGSMATVWAGQVAPGSPRKITTWQYGDSDKPLSFDRGAEIGRFLLGSTVILLFPKDTIEWHPALGIDQAIKMGELLATH